MSDAPCMPLLRERAAHFDTRLCIGLDPDPARIPPILNDDPDPILTFCRGVVESTSEAALAYKVNAAFFEAEGHVGWERLEALLAAIPDEIPVILDAKRGDIGNSSRWYAQMAFETLAVDAITVSPWMGRDSLQPFLDFEERGIFVLAATSNPGAGDFQALLSDGDPISIHVGRAAASWNEEGNVGLVIGATQHDLMARLRKEAPDLPFLVPGIGAQGGDPAAVMGAALDRLGEGVIINVSRSILYTEDPDFERGARNAATQLRGVINDAREKVMRARV